MDIKIAYSWIKEYLDIDIPHDEFARKMSLCGPSIERWSYSESLKDYILDIEVTSNRVDAASVIGICREAQAILGCKLKKDLFILPELNNQKKYSSAFPLNVFVESNLCRRYQSLIIDNVKVRESPKWLKDRIESAGLNSINNLVDITNYVLLEYGQPTHIFDYKRINGKKIIVRNAKEEEEFIALGTLEKYKLSNDNLVIADELGVIALAGVKGGENSAVSNDTKTIVIESASFDPVSIRKTSRKNNLITDASLLFEKDIHPKNTEFAIKRVAELVLNVCGGEVVSELIDVKKVEFSEFKRIQFSLLEIPRILGIEINKEIVKNILEKLGFYIIKEDNNTFFIEVPFYRMNDINFDYDIVEEIARIYGYHNIPSVLLDTQIPQEQINLELHFENKIRDILVGAGLTETYTYSFVPEKYLITNTKQFIKVANPLTLDFMYLRTELLQSLIKVVEENEELVDTLHLFEISKVYIPKEDRVLPQENLKLAICVNGDSPQEAFYIIQAYWNLLIKRLNLDDKIFHYFSTDSSTSDIFSKVNSSNLFYKNKRIGTIGLISEKVKNQLKLKKHLALFELDIDIFVEILSNKALSYKPISKFPSIYRDFSFIVDKKVKWSEIVSSIYLESGIDIKNIQLFDVFQLKNDENLRSLTFRVEWNNENKTLTDKEVNLYFESIVKLIKTKFKAILRDK